MTSKVSALVLSIAFALTGAMAASAQDVGGPYAEGKWARYPLVDGDAQFQIGDGLPIPILPGGVKPIQGAQIRQPISGPDPRPLQLIPGQLTHAGTPFNLPVFANNSKLFQVNTGVIIEFPNAYANLRAGGRTGGPTVTWCPGQLVVGGGNPGCAAADQGPGPIAGLMRYTATGAQFGGAARGKTGGFADVALRVSAGAPCDGINGATPNPGCLVIFALATPAGTGAQGASFGVVVSTAGDAPATGLFRANIAANGNILSVTPTGLGPGIPNPATSFGAPWTTGMLTVQKTDALGAPETFVLSGSDTRVSGVGSISLVSGSLSDRDLSGPNANRGWVTLTIGDVTGTPALGTWGIGALSVVLAGAAVRRLRKSA